ncbi:MAG TPA: NAD(P)-dependent oxidoreductase [Woeseiaceae bacterium]|nr:NAD(P)-dependent oxidoreductase [Woeseiaceae bacterium]
MKLIQCTSAGVDRYHPFDWLSNGTTLSNASGVHAEKVGEFGLMATLMLHSRVPQIATNQRLKLWDRRLREPAEGCRVLVYGVGALGGAVAQRLQAAGFAVNGIRKSGLAHPAVNQMFAPEHFIEELKRTDILILACPLTPQTHKLVGPRELAVLPKGAGLLNISRAGVVDHLELTKSLENEHLSGAILDVFEEEPLPADDLLWDTKNLMVFPHVSADAPEGYIDRCLHILRQNLEHSAEGLPLLNTVDRIAGY